MLLNFTIQMKNRTALEKYLSQLTITKNSQSESIETNSIQIFIKERRNLGKRFLPSIKHIINKWVEVDKVKAEDMAMAIPFIHLNHIMDLHHSNSSTLNNNTINNSSNINNSSMLSRIMVPQNKITIKAIIDENDKET